MSSVFSNIDAVLQNPASQTGMKVLVAANPEVGLALELVAALLHGWETRANINDAIALLDKQAAGHMQRLTTMNLPPVERSEVEIRLHEVLTLILKLGGL